MGYGYVKLPINCIKKKIDLLILELIITISLSNFIANHHIGNPYENVLKTFQHTDVHKLLQRIIKELETDTALHKHITTVLSNKFPESWHSHIMVTHVDRDYYRDRFPFCDIISDAVRDKKYWEEWHLSDQGPLGVEQSPYFLMVMEHPMYYYQAHFGAFSEKKDGIQVLRDHR